MAQLNEALRHLPPVSKLHIAGPEVKRLCSVISTSYSLRQSLETMLAQAQQLVEIYPDTISLAVTHDDVAQYPFELAAHRSAPLDFLLLNQLVSCHYRLYDITELFLFHIHLCFKLSISSNPGEVHQFEIPQLRIGSFTPSPRFSPSIITTVLIDQQSSLASFLASLQIALHGTSGRESQVLTMECDMLKDRAESIAGRLVKFRDASNKSGLVS
ncbi:Transcription factor ACEII [Colletotrichum orbiculare MAFF 240422]|uniref:Transcription factor ACEII n=1 Tax=Colletotrichum orbiculare (strain 104-T / ATCC 96160 / CBS 514.97 / LARS 414 / MAFF 240422) TaxID=1213857 RepID=A0A484FJU1_COLOR|nr:Transcription factor ACEII [Colletotrichum orbiculare MAFF 240422]